MKRCTTDLLSQACVAWVSSRLSQPYCCYHGGYLRGVPAGGIRSTDTSTTTYPNIRSSPLPSNGSPDDSTGERRDLTRLFGRCGGRIALVSPAGWSNTVPGMLIDRWKGTRAIRSYDTGEARFCEATTPFRSTVTNAVVSLAPGDRDNPVMSRVGVLTRLQ